MDIMNELPDDQFARIDDLLAFVSIYDDEQRTAAYMAMLEAERESIKGAVCVEAGCGFGLIAEKCAQLGAQRVYAVEMNPHLAMIARRNLSSYANVRVIEQDIRRFMPPEKIDLLVQEFFGQLLFDEDLYTLQKLSFTPQAVLPHRAVLKYALVNSNDYVDDVVTPQVMGQLKGALISGLFEWQNLQPNGQVLQWTREHFPKKATVDISGQPGDLLCFYLEIFHRDQMICRTGECSNWSPVWTPRAGDVFTFRFKPGKRGTAVYFDWVK